jgi:p-aminobenzoyl-glutamate transporter AbgT
MLGFFIKPEHRLVAFFIAIALAISGLVYGFSTGAFQQNNREALRAERESAKVTDAR